MSKKAKQVQASPGSDSSTHRPQCYSEAILRVTKSKYLHVSPPFEPLSAYPHPPKPRPHPRQNHSPTPRKPTLLSCVGAHRPGTLLCRCPMRSALSRLNGLNLAITGSRVCSEVTGEARHYDQGAVAAGSDVAVVAGSDGCFALCSSLCSCCEVSRTQNKLFEWLTLQRSRN